MKFEVMFMFWKALGQHVYPLQIGSLMVEVYDLKKRRWSCGQEIKHCEKWLGYPREAAEGGLGLDSHADFGLLRQLDKALALEADLKMEGGWVRLIWGFLTPSSCFSAEKYKCQVLASCAGARFLGTFFGSKGGNLWWNLPLVWKCWRGRFCVSKVLG